jgi:hypothetical protein
MKGNVLICRGENKLILWVKDGGWWIVIDG